MNKDLSTTSSKPGQRTRKFQQRKHLPSYWELLGDKFRARKTKEKKSEFSGSEGEDRSRHAQGHNSMGFSQRMNTHRTNDDDDDMVPQQQFGNAPNQAPQGGFFGQGQAQSHRQSQPQFHQMPAMDSARGLRSGEMDAHLRRGGQTEFGERPRGQGPSVYIDSEGPVRGGDRGDDMPSRRQPQHPWEPETRVYEQERTRMR